MKRSSTGDFTKNKKLCLSSSPTHSSDSSSSKSNNSNSMTNIVEQIKDMVLRLDKGDLDFCISQTPPAQPSIQNDQDDDNADISIALHKALKNIAQRQLKLETENKRYQIAIKQQHHLLTQQQQQQQQNKNDQEQEQAQEENESVVNKSNGTPEDCISSFRQSPMLEKLRLSPTTGNLIFMAVASVECY